MIKFIYHLLTKNKLGSYYWKKKFGSFGNGSYIQGPGYVTGHENIYLGENTTILSNNRLNVYNNLTGLKSKLVLGNNCYIGFNFTALCGENITIGNEVLIASSVFISSENHGMNPESDVPYMDQPLECKPVTIDDGTWIGEKVCILPGVTIGKKCIIGAGAVVNKSIPDYSMAVGVPAKVIKKYNFKTHSWEKVK